MAPKFVTYAQNFEDVMLWRALREVAGGFYVDVGANSPLIGSVTRSFYERGWHGVNIEPNPRLATAFAELRPRDINLAVAVGEEPGELTMTFARNSGLSTLDEAAAARLVRQGMRVERAPVPVTTLAAIWAEHIPAHQPVHFLKVDVEGFERQVLAGHDWRDPRPWVVVVEATRPQSTEESYADWAPMLEAADYAEVYADGLNRFYLAREHADLASRFRYPPNVFDDFVQASEGLALDRARRAEAQLRSMRASRSWRVTAPLRAAAAVGERLRLGRPGGRGGRSGRGAAELPLDAAPVEHAVAAFRRERRPARETEGRTPAGAAEEAAEQATALRAAGQERPVVVMTLPALEGNPYTALMEQAFPAAGLAAVHVDDLASAAAIVGGGKASGYATVLQVNASNRLVWRARDAAEAAAIVTDALAAIDRWRAEGMGLVVSVHDGPILRDVHAAAEQAIAQGLADRADAIHVLTASTPEALGDWLRLDPAKTVHLPIPRYDGVYDPLPDRAAARAGLGLDPVDPAEGGSEIVLGMIGLLSPRKGPQLLVDALATVPDPLPDGRRLRLVLAGRVIDPGGESLIRSAFADDRIVTQFGWIPDATMPSLLATLDVAVVPYQRYLNSSWLTLALTAGIPAIAPDGGMAAETVRPGALRTFTAGDVVSLAAALARAGELTSASARREARASVADLDADAISARFAALLRSSIENRPLVGTAG